MGSPLQVRRMTVHDLAFAHWLRGEVGWNQTLEDWKRFLELEPDGCFLAEWCGTPVGTATTTTYGPELGWIGMVLVHPEYRRRGIARTLLDICIAHLRDHGVHCIKLDATPAGRPVYLGLGFKDEWPLSRWECKSSNLTPTALASMIRGWQGSDTGRTGACDLAAVGVSRQRLLRALMLQSRQAVVFEDESGRVAGFGLVRKGSRALYLGPIVAETPDIGTALVEALVAQCQGEPLFWDVPEANTAATGWAGEHGWSVQRSLMRMYLGENLASGNPQKQFGLAGPEVG